MISAPAVWQSGIPEQIAEVTAAMARWSKIGRGTEGDASAALEASLWVLGDLILAYFAARGNAPVPAPNATTPGVGSCGHCGFLHDCTGGPAPDPPAPGAA